MSYASSPRPTFSGPAHIPYETVTRHLWGDGGDESLYLLTGSLNVRVPENDGQRWFELKPGDGFYIPQGVPHQYYNMSNQPVELIFGVAPDYGDHTSMG